MIQLKDIGVSFGARALFREANLTIAEGSRIGLVGANGTGKTTLFRILHGDRGPDEGVLEMPKGTEIGYLPQEELVLGSESVFEEAVAAFNHIHDIREKMHRLELAMKDTSLSKAELERILKRYSRLQEEHAGEGFVFEARTERILQGLGFSQEDFSRPCQEFSGGYQMRVALARLLLSDPDLLLLDEPTNHLDLPSIEWLESFIKGYKGALVISSHDRYFLDRVVGEIWDIDYGTVTSYKGNYSAFSRKKKEHRKHIQKKIEKIAQTRRHLQRFIDMYRAHPKKATLVRSRKRMLERLPDVQLPREEKKTMHLRFPDAPKISGRVLALEDIAKSFDGNQVFSEVDLTAEPGDRIALVGANGEGKTTLLRIMAGELEPSTGSIWESGKLARAFYTQKVEEGLHPQNTVIQELEEVAPGEPFPVLRTIAGMFLFSADEADKKVAILSGGEKSRLALAKIILSPSNLLLLDEPTNHLDLRAREVLERALKDYPGTVVFASHDRFLIDRLANKVAWVGKGKVQLHLGNWSDFCYWRESLKRKEPDTIREEKKETEGPKKSPGPRKSPRAERKREEKKSVEEEVESAFRRIEELETRIGDLERRMASPELYEDVPRMREITSKHQRLKKELEGLEGKIEELLS